MDGEAVEETAPRAPLPGASAAEDLGPALAALVKDNARGVTVHEPS